jgi:glycosyltransferase involved in cell wall biosynthesis
MQGSPAGPTARPGGQHSPPPPSAPDETRLLILIPAHNEARTIAELVARCRAYAPVLVVDDGSSDETAALARSAGATVVSHPRNRGKSAALRTGFRIALEQGYAAVLTLDGDGQHDPAEIPRLLEAHRRGARLVIGSRRYGPMPFRRRIANLWGRRLLERVLGTSLPDNQSGFRIIDAGLLRELPDYGEHFQFEVVQVAEAVRRGVEIAWMPIRTIYAGEGSHFRPVVDTLRFLSILLRIAWRHRRSPRRTGDEPPAASS